MKAILVTDMPKDCIECPIHDGEYGICNAVYKPHSDDYSKKRESWCPLKPMPQKDIYDSNNWATVDVEDSVTLGDYLNKARNEVIDEILGEMKWK